MSNDTAQIELERKIKELNEITRVVTNGLNFLCETTVKLAYIAPVNEFVTFLQGFKVNVAQQTETLKAALPKPEVKAEEAIVPEIVK